MILPWSSLSKDQREILEKEVREVFFESSSVKKFESESKKHEFFQKWLGLYIDQFPDWFYLAIDDENNFLGYIIACPNSLDHPELGQPIVGNEKDYLEYPVHLHINCHYRSRGKGVGAELLSSLEQVSRERGAAGIHLITKEGERNVGFYLKNGYTQIRSKIVGNGNLLFLGKKLIDA